MEAATIVAIRITWHGTVPSQCNSGSLPLSARLMTADWTMPRRSWNKECLNHYFTDPQVILDYLPTGQQCST